jgi:hypothetical protein
MDFVNVETDQYVGYDNSILNFEASQPKSLGFIKWCQS